MADSVNITTRAGTGASVNSVVGASGAVSSAVASGSEARSSVAAGNSFQTTTTGASGPQGEPGEDGIFSAIASQAEAEAGSNNTKGMTPLRTAQAIAALQSDVVDSVNGATGTVVLDQDDIGDGSTYKQYSGTEKTKLAGIATAATANDTDANLKNRANHTGTQAISTVTGLQTAIDGKAATAHTHTEADITDLGIYVTQADIDTSIAALIDSSPGTLDTLNELAAALGDDANFASTVTTALATKAADADVVHDTGAETIAGVKTFSSDPLIPDEAYGAGWNGSLEPPTKNAVYDKIELITGSSGVATANSPNANEFARFTDSSTIEGRTASEVKADLDLEVGTDLQAYDADLTTIAGLTATTDNFIQSKSSAWASRTPAQVAVDLLPYVYPVGCIYFSTNSTNPGTSLGFGTWSAFGAGRVPVGFDSGQTEFDTDEETGGSKTQASNVTVATQPTFTVNSHTHSLSDSGQAKITVTAAGNVLTDVVAASSWTSDRRTNATSNAAQASFTEGAGLTGATDATAGTDTTRTADVALTNNAVNNLQPYITVRMWKRTA